jgi:hypothetical protein
MTDAYLEFVNENSYRRYPLIEDSSATSVSGVELPNDLIVDARIVSRRNVPGFYVSSYDAEEQRLVISSNDDAVSIPINLSGIDPAQLPIRVTASNSDPDYPGYSDVKVCITIGYGLEEFISDQSSSASFLPTQTPFENSVVVDISGSIVNLLGAICSTPGSSFLVKQDVGINGGYNTRSSQFDNTINVFTDPSGGQLGNYRGESIQSPCSEIVYSINGVPPDSLGKFSFVPKTGISIESNPQAHSITISLNTSNMGAAQCSS